MQHCWASQVLKLINYQPVQNFITFEAFNSHAHENGNPEKDKKKWHSQACLYHKPIDHKFTIHFIAIHATVQGKEKTYSETASFILMACLWGSTFSFHYTFSLKLWSFKLGVHLLFLKKKRFQKFESLKYRCIL